MTLVNVEASRLLDGDHPASWKAASWIREHFLVPDNQPIVELFEMVFNCKIVVENRHDAWMVPDHILFNTEQDLTMFLLRWQ